MEAYNKVVWSALEYEEKERSSDWFWALGIIVITSSIASIIFGDYFFAALIIISGLLLGFFSIRKPHIIDYELNNKGFKIGNLLYPYENIKSFWVQVEEPNSTSDIKPILFIKSERIFMPIITAPIEIEKIQEIHSLMISKNITEEEMKEHPAEKIMEALGF